MGFHPIDLAAWNPPGALSPPLPPPGALFLQHDRGPGRHPAEKEGEGPFTPAMLHSLATVVNRRQEFRMALDENGSPGSFDQLSPSYTVFHPKTETFSCLWTEYTPDYALFLRRYEEDMRLYGEVEAFEAKPNTPAASFNVSMIPWQSFSSFHLELPRGEDYLLPHFHLGTLPPGGGKAAAAPALQVHHAVCDGFHACRFVEELQALVSGEGALE